MVSHESHRRTASLSHIAEERKLICTSQEGENESHLFQSREIKPLLHLTILIVEATWSWTLKGSFAVANGAFDESPVGLPDNKPMLGFMKYSAMRNFIMQPEQNNRKIWTAYYGPRCAQAMCWICGCIIPDIKRWFWLSYFDPNWK